MKEWPKYTGFLIVEKRNWDFKYILSTHLFQRYPVCKLFVMFISEIFLLTFFSYAACLDQFPKINAVFLMYDDSNKPNNFQIWWPILFQLSRNCFRYTLVFLHEPVNSWNNCTTASLGEVCCCWWLVCHLPPLFMHKMCEYFKICN
jgi:hypothetical protein